MSVTESNQLNNDLVVGRNLATGGDLSVKGNATIGHDLKVEGYLEAPNIKGINKGVFMTVEELNAAYPNPEYGWLACVGIQSPFAAYVGKGGRWVATGGYIDIGDGGSVQPDPTPGYDVVYPTDPTEHMIIGIGNNAPEVGAGNTVVIGDGASVMNPADPNEPVEVRVGSAAGSARESSVFVGNDDNNIVVDTGGTTIGGAFEAAGTGNGGIVVDDGGISISGPATFGEDVLFSIPGSRITIDDGNNSYTLGEMKDSMDDFGNRIDGLETVIHDSDSSIEIGDGSKDINLDATRIGINAGHIDIAGAITYNSAESPSLRINGLAFDGQTISCPGAQGDVNLEAENITISALYDDQQGNVSGTLRLDSKQIDIGGSSDTTSINGTNSLVVGSDTNVTIVSGAGNGGTASIVADKTTIEAVDDDNLYLNNTPLSAIKISSIDTDLDQANAGLWNIQVAMNDGSVITGSIDLANLKAALANV